MKTYRKIHNFKQPRVLPVWITNKSNYGWLIVTLAISTVFAFVIILISTYLDIPFSQVKISDYKLNEVAPHDFIVSRDIAYIDEKATKAAKEANARKVYPVFELNNEVSSDSFETFNDFISILSENALKNATPDTVLNEIQINLPQLIDIFGRKEIIALLPILSVHPAEPPY